MDGFKEFQGKNLDTAIDEACAYFDTAREKLEIDIVQDAKSGIFGIVGARKAVVRVRRVPMMNRDEAQGARPAEQPVPTIGAKAERKPESDGERKNSNGKKKPELCSAPAMAPAPAPASAAPAASPQPASTPAPEKKRQPRPEKIEPLFRKAPDARANSVEVSGRDDTPNLPHMTDLTDMSDLSDLPDLDDDSAGTAVPFENIDREQLKAVCEEVVTTLVRPIIATAQVTVEVQNDRVLIGITSDEDSGLLIGREGQTLSALQYMSSRLVGRRMECAVRMQFDVDNYRRRQDDHLRQRAEELAARVRATGKSCSTRPLSSYHRRVIHVTLQNDPDIITRSIGDGALKRVVIQRRRRNDARESKE